MYIYVHTLYNGPLKLIIEIMLGNGQGILNIVLVSPQDAFWALVSLFERSKYLAGFYDSSLSK